MTQRDALLDRLADVAERDRAHPDWKTPDMGYAPAGLDTLFEYHPDQSLRQVALTTAHIARSIARLAGIFDGRAFNRLCTDLSFYLGDELEDRIREGAASGKLSDQTCSGRGLDCATEPVCASAFAPTEASERGMSQRDDLLDRLADIAGIDPTNINAPHTLCGHNGAGLTSYLQHLPDHAIQELLLTTAVFARRLAILGGRLDARPLDAFLLQVRIDLLDLMEEMVTEFGGDADTPPRRDQALVDESADLPGADGLPLEGKVGDLQDEHAKRVERHTDHDRVPQTARSASRVLHLTLPLLAGLIAGAAGSYLVRGKGAA